MDKEKKDEVASKETVETANEVKEEAKTEKAKTKTAAKKEAAKKEPKEEKAEVKAEVKEETETKSEENAENKGVVEEKAEAKVEAPKVENISSKSSSGNKAPLILGIVAVLLLAIAVIIFYIFNNSSSPDKIFKSYIDSYKEAFLNAEDISDAKFIESNSSLDVELNLMDGLIDENLLKLINDLKLDMNVQVDLEKNEMGYKLNATKNSNKVVDLEAYLVGNKMYAKLNGLLDKIVYTDVEEFSLNYSKFTDTEKTFVVSILDALSNSLEPGYFTQEKIDGEKKNILSLNDEKIKAIITEVFTNLKNDEEFCDAASEIFEISKDELKSSLEEAISGINREKILEEDQTIEIALFTKGMKDDLTRAVVEFKNDTTVGLNVTMDIINDNQIDYSISVAGEKVTGSIICDSKSMEDIDLTISFKYGEYVDAKVIMNYGYSVDKQSGVSVPSDLSSAVEINSITQKDMQDFLTNVQKNEDLMDVVNTVSELVGDSKNLIDPDDDDDKEIDKDDDDDELTVPENVIQRRNRKVTFKVPQNYILDEEYSTDEYKYFELDSKKEDIEVYLKISYDTEEDYFETFDEYEYEWKLKDDFYSNVEKTDIQEIKVGKNTAKYVKLTYSAGSSSKYEEIFAIYQIDDDYAYIVEIEANGTTIPNKVLRDFLDITVE